MVQIQLIGIGAALMDRDQYGKGDPEFREIIGIEECL